MIGRKPEQDYLETLLRKNNDLERRVKQLEEAQRTHVPTYDLAGGSSTPSTETHAPTNAAMGEVAVGSDDALHWHTSSGWKTAGGGGSVETLFLWSSWDDSDSDITVPAYTGFGGTFTCAYQHSRSTSTFWNNLQLNGSIVTSLPYDRVVVPPGEYLVDAWWLFTDDGFDTWLGAQLNLVINGGTIFPNRYYAVSRKVDSVTSYGANDPQNPGYTGMLEVGAHSFTVPAGKTGSIYTDLFHADNHTIDLRQNWTLGIHKLS